MAPITEPCPEGCGGQIIVGMFDTISVPKLDEAGNPVVPAQKVRLRLPQHLMRPLGNAKDPGQWDPASETFGPSRFDADPEPEPWGKFDPTGLAPSYCQHGLETHPDPEIEAAMKRKYGAGISFVRAKYVDVQLRGNDPPVTGCVVCFGQPQPADFTTPRDDTPIHALMPMPAEDEAALLGEAFPQ